MKEDITNFSFEKLIRRRDQTYEMAAMARQDGDRVDETRRLLEIKLYTAEIARRMEK